MEQEVQSMVSELLGKYGWLFLVGVLTLLFRATIEKFVAGFIIFRGNDYNEDDVVEVDGKPGRIVRVGVWSTTFFTYDVRDGIIVGGAKLVIQNDKLKDIKIEKPLLCKNSASLVFISSKYGVPTTKFFIFNSFTSFTCRYNTNWLHILYTLNNAINSYL